MSGTNNINHEPIDPIRPRGRTERGTSRRSEIILAWLLDGDWHHVSEFYAEVVKTIDPAVATKSFVANKSSVRRRGILPIDDPLDYQISWGKFRVFMGTIWHMVKANYIETWKDQRCPKDVNRWKVRLTENGLRRIRSTGVSASQAGGSIWRIFRRLIEEGKLRMLIEAAERGFIPQPVKDVPDVTEDAADYAG